MIYLNTGRNSYYEVSLLLKDFLQSPVYSFIFLLVALNFRQLIPDK